LGVLGLARRRLVLHAISHRGEQTPALQGHVGRAWESDMEHPSFRLWQADHTSVRGRRPDGGEVPAERTLSPV
jgi:hypothetical protein